MPTKTAASCDYCHNYSKAFKLVTPAAAERNLYVRTATDGIIIDTNDPLLERLWKWLRTPLGQSYLKTTLGLCLDVCAISAPPLSFPSTSLDIVYAPLLSKYIPCPAYHLLVLFLITISPCVTNVLCLSQVTLRDTSWIPHSLSQTCILTYWIFGLSLKLQSLDLKCIIRSISKHVLVSFNGLVPISATLF